MIAINFKAKINEKVQFTANLGNDALDMTLKY